VIRVGPAGWAYKDWEGIVYPKPKPRGFEPLQYLAAYFDAVEINTSYYGPITPKTAGGWVQKIEEFASFRFTAKLWKGFTHERNATAEDEQLVRAGFDVLLEAGRLGAVLMQFPWSWKNTSESRQYVANLCVRFRAYPLVLEVRHSSWNEPGVLDFLEQLDIGLCNIDQPLFHRSVTPGAQATSSIGYIRLHGRNYKTWFAENAKPHERYDYLYKFQELEPWIDRVKAVARQTKDCYVMTNNHYLGKATVNALQIKSFLFGSAVSAPAQLVQHYPELREFTTSDEGQPAQ
jgi:uncharacterized protein YecE (DUF72 family)